MNIKNGNTVSALLTLVFFAFGCGFANTRAEEKQNENRQQQAAVENNGGENVEQTPTDDISVSAVVGTYEYDSEKDGEGYDNQLEITRADAADKLFVYISGSYIYKMGETQTMKEAEGKGDAVLRGNRADATLVDEAGKPCRATIVFKEATAAVKIPDSCQFNIQLGGLYKKAAAENKTEKTNEVTNGKTSEKNVGKNAGNRSGNLPEVAYEKAMDFVNDFDAHKVGEEFVITGVPTEILNRRDRADEMGNTAYKNLYFLQGVTDDDTPSYTVMTSRAMIDSLAKAAEYEPVILRMTAVNIESRGKFDVYRMPFVTKIEGFNSDGDVIWTAVGTKPAKLNYTH